MQDSQDPDFCSVVDPVVLRDRGNKYFKCCQYLRAIMLYTKSLAMAPSGSSLRGLAYGNRSAVLLALGLYKECIEDAEAALKNNYPKNLAQKLYLRMSVCHKALGRKLEAENCAKKVTELIESLKISHDQKSELTEQSSELFERHHTPNVPKISVEYVEPPSLDYGPNKKNPNLSSALSIRKVPLTGGQVLLANRDISIGDVLAVETPVIYGLGYTTGAYEKYWCYCHECFKMCLNLTPCASCSWACYCSQKCAEDAWTKYHSVECAPKELCLARFIKLCNGGKLGREDLFSMTQDAWCKYYGVEYAPKDLCLDGFYKLFDKRELNREDLFSITYNFKIVASLGLKNCITALASNGELTENASPEIKALFQPHKYKSHSEHYKDMFYNAKGVFLRIIVAESFGLDERDFQKLSNFLQASAPYAAGLRLLSLEPTVSPDVDFSRWDLARGQGLGWGIYLSVAYFHAWCDGNVDCSFHQKTGVFRALKPIKKGDQLFMRTTSDWKDTPLQFRMSASQHKKFKCRCDACCLDWPVLLLQCKKIPKILTTKHAGLLKKFKQVVMQCLFDGDVPVTVFTRENFEVASEVFKVLLEVKPKSCYLIRSLAEYLVENYFMLQSKKFHLADDSEIEFKNINHYLVADTPTGDSCLITFAAKHVNAALRSII